jgi:hypothetical protein
MYMGTTFRIVAQPGKEAWRGENAPTAPHTTPPVPYRRR